MAGAQQQRRAVPRWKLNINLCISKKGKGSFAVSLQVRRIINPAVGCHYFPIGLQLPSQPFRGLLPISLLGEQRHDGGAENAGVEIIRPPNVTTANCRTGNGKPCLSGSQCYFRVLHMTKLRIVIYVSDHQLFCAGPKIYFCNFQHRLLKQPKPFCFPLTFVSLFLFSYLALLRQKSKW